jgi:PAS domain S-box-containing protein
VKKLTVYHILVALLTLIFLLALSIYFWGKEKWSFVLIIAIALLYLLCIYLLYRHFRVAIPHLIEISDEVSIGNFNTSLRRRVDKTLLPLVYSFNSVVNNFKNATDFAIHIGEGKFDAPFQKAGEGDLLGEALIEMRNKLKKAHEDEEERRRQGRIRGEMGNLLRQYQRSDLKTLCDAFLAKLIPILDLNQGGIFLIVNEGNTQPFLELVSCYAYNKKKYIEKRLSINQGLTGQCIKEKNTIYLEEIPENYVYITSGLGQATPKSLLLVPIKANEKMIGVLELASFHSIRQENIQLLEVLSERLGGIIATIQTNEQTKQFLEEATRINMELLSKENLMRQNAEELSKTKEELSKKLLEQQQESNLMKYILEAINKTNAAIEFDFEGNIISVNEMYLKVMGYQKEELIGQNERILLPKDEIDSQRYRLLWESLKSGTHITGEYRRVSKSGKEVWLNGTYNPIFDIEGRPTSVVQFAQFTTEEKEKDLDYASKIGALNQSVPVVELDLNCHIKTANQLFASQTQYKRNQLMKKNFCELIPDANDFQKEWEQIITGEVKNMVLMVTAADNSLMFFHANFSPIRNLEGKISKIQAIMVNITEQKEMEIKLVNKKEAMREAIEKLELTQKELKNREAELEKLLAQENAKNNTLNLK